MSIALPSMTPAQESLFLTLGFRALDSRLSPPFLGDPMAAEIVEASGFDMSRFPQVVSERGDPRIKAVDVGVRTKREDEVVTRFVAARPDAVVLDLGTGLDTRVFRVDPPPTVDWYDVDFPEVIELRRQLVPPRTNTHLIGADVTEPGWLDTIPADRPAMIVHDGLVPFLTMHHFQTLLRKLTDHFTGGEMAHNSYTRFAVWVLKRSGLFGTVPGTGFNDPREPEGWVPGLRLVEEIFAIRSPEISTLTSSWAMRWMIGVSARSTLLSRHLGAAVLHYRF